MNNHFFLLLSIPFLLSACTKCVECEVKLKQSQEVIGYVDEFCGTDKKVEEEEERLKDEHTCIECIVQTGFGETRSGVVCGDLHFTDSVEAGWEEAALGLGTSANCTYYRDTVNVTCVLKN